MEHYDWNDGWLFAPVFTPALVQPDRAEELTPVRVPHTVKPLPYNYCNENDYQRLSGYRKEFFAPKEWEGRTVLLTFGAVAHDATVFCNGRRMFHHGCGYTAFTVDLTAALRLGQKNVVAVRCDSREDLNIPPFGGQLDGLTYGGIYRAVSLDIKEPAYLRDIFIEAKAEGDFRIYSSTVGETVGCTLQAEIRSPSGSRALYQGELSLPIVGTLNGVHPWSLEHPSLYTLTVRLIRPGTNGLPDRVLDERSTRFGFRTLQFVAGGLYLNGQRVELRGLNRHQSYAYQGYAMPDSIQRLDAQLLKKAAGLQRRPHSATVPPAPPSSMPATSWASWCSRKCPAGSTWATTPGKPRLCRTAGRWSASTATTPASFCGACGSAAAPTTRAFYKRTNETVRRLDPTRPTAGSPQQPEKPAAGGRVRLQRLFLPGPRRRAARPAATSRPTPARATSSASLSGQQFPAKAFDDEPHRLAQALRYAAVLNDSIAQQGVAGSFGWCMTDYNTHREFGSGDRVSYHGVMDLFRNPKLSAAVYASQKTPRAPSDIVLEVSSGMALGDHAGRHSRWPAGSLPTPRVCGSTGTTTSWPSSRPTAGAGLPPCPHPPIEIHDFVGSCCWKNTRALDRAAAPQVAAILNEMRRDAMELSPLSRARMLLAAAELRNELLRLYYKYIGVLGSPTSRLPLRGRVAWPGRPHRREGAGAERPAGMHRPQPHPDRRPHLGLRRRQPAGHRPERQPPALLRRGRSAERGGAAARSLAPASCPLRGGMAGTYLATTGEAGPARLHCRMEGALDTEASLTIRCREE